MVTFSQLRKVTCLAVMILMLSAMSAMAQRDGGGRPGGGGDRGRGGGGSFFGNMSEEEQKELRDKITNMSSEERRTFMQERFGNRGGGDQGGRSRGGSGGGFGSGRMPQNADERWAMMSRRYKEGFSDDEWKIVEPRLRPVAEKVREIETLRFSGRYGRGPSGGDDAPETTASKLRAETSALRDLLDKADSSTGDIKKKMSSIRALRKKAESEQKKMEGDLKNLRAKLREVLSIRQEAKLFTDGLLD